MNDIIIKYVANTIKDISNEILNDMQINKVSAVGRDIKLNVDIILDNAIRAFLTKKFNYPVISEENETTRQVPNGKYWILDPLDGSMNYYRNFPMACISVALFDDLNPMYGIIINVNNNDVYIAGVLNHIAHKNGKQITLSNTIKLSETVLATGFPINKNYDHNSLIDYVNIAQNVKKVRMIGSAGMSLVYVASGVFDAYYEENIMLWDVAAGLGLVKAAGGYVRFNKGTLPFSYTVFASNGNIKSINN